MNLTSSANPSVIAATRLQNYNAVELEQPLRCRQVLRQRLLC